MPALADIRPNGTSQYRMEDFYYAGGIPGGIPALMKQLEDELHLDGLAVNGKTRAKTSPVHRSTTTT